MDKTAIRNFAIEARKILMKSAITEAGFYGITKDGCKDPVQKGNDFEVYETVAGTENRIFGDDIKRRANLVQAVKTLGFEQVIEETAYTWFNRIIAIRFMEVNNYLPTRVRVLSSETGSGTPDIITQADTVELNLTSDELEKIQTAKRENRYDDAFRMLFIKQCNELNAILPGLFEKTDDYMELLLKITYTGDGVIRMLVDSIPEDNFNVETEGQVEIIGWMYQYYNTELKDDTFAKLKKNVKITKERIPAATQLFTPDWIVRYMVENSLGRVWIEHLRAVNPSVDEKAKAEEFGWKYYLPEAEQEDDVQAQLVEIRKSYKDLTPQDITCIDPCMGSGHILVYMFDVLMDIYRSEGFSEREAVFDILENNIRGLDIDRRAYQLSYFALMMKARGYNRIFFRGHEDLEGNRVQVVPRVYAIEESNSIDREQLKYFGAGLDELSKNNAINQMNGLLDALHDAKEFGSILKIEKYDWNLLKSYISKMNDDGQASLFGFMAYQSKPLIERLINIGQALSDQYHVVITNPPYMSSGGMGAKLTKYVKEQYSDQKADMFAACMEKGFSMVRSKGYMAMITMESWMFLPVFETFRKRIIESYVIKSLIHMPYLGKGGTSLGIAFGNAAFVFQSDNYIKSKGRYQCIRYYETDEDGKPFAFPTLNERKADRAQEDFMMIESSPVAYWASDAVFDVFSHNRTLKNYIDARSGISTGDNNLYYRCWFECAYGDISFDYRDTPANSNYKWFPTIRGGDFRKWYGNMDNVLNLKNEGFDIRNSGNNYRLRTPEFYNKRGITWNRISSRDVSFRLKTEQVNFGENSPCMFLDGVNIYEMMGFLNSKVSKALLKFINSTMTYQVIDIQSVPYINTESEELIELVKTNIQIAKEDWDSFEKSWDFKKHPFLRYRGSVESDYESWKAECEKRRVTLKQNEERINEILIERYGLGEDITPEIVEEDITLYQADKEKDIKSFISYAVGCMFGRYSLDYDGVVLAGGCMQQSQYSNYIPDQDGIIPITDEKYFEDDIVDRFCEWLVCVYGKESLEENLAYIANVLNNKNTNSREALRDYFIKEFYKDHCYAYSVTSVGKRPIYWLFDAGTENGFKALIYIHRYNEDTVGRIRSDYITRIQTAIETALRNAEYAINTTGSAVDRAQATKKRDKYIKQLAEIRAYYPALSHIALQRIPLDVDDGVKVNYEKFQGIEVSIEGEKKQKVDLLAKI